MKEVKEEKSSLIVQIVNDETESLSETLGISEERCEYLGNKLRKGMYAFDTLTDVAHELSKECKHVNEIWWVAMQMGGNSARANSQDMLKDLLRGFKGKDGE